MKRYGYPPLKKYLDQEVETFKFLRSNSYMSQYSLFVKDLASVYSRLRSKSISSINISFKFSTKLDNKPHDVKLAADVVFDKEKISRSSFIIEIYGVSSKGEGSNVVRRIHFDVAVIGVDINKGCHPLYHVQVGGVGSGVERGLSFPRVLFFPLSFALFFDMAIRELGTMELKRVIESGKWREILRANEDLMVIPFCKEVFRRRQNSSTFVIPDVYYESGDET